MATVVAIMDRAGWSGWTDNVVVVDRQLRRLRSIPRDLWCPEIGDRINTAFARGGHRRLLAALGGQGIEVQHSICVRREATERALADIAVSVPVPRRLIFWYPLSPHSAIEDGRKLVEFFPPAETLEGERIHQWLGARYEPGTARDPDFHRITRQQVFLQSLLRQGFNFEAVLDDPELVSISSPQAIVDLSGVRHTWRFDILGGLVRATIDGKAVLVRSRFGRLSIHPPRRWRAIR